MKFLKYFFSIFLFFFAIDVSAGTMYSDGFEYDAGALSSGWVSFGGGATAWVVNNDEHDQGTMSVKNNPGNGLARARKNINTSIVQPYSLSIWTKKTGSPISSIAFGIGNEVELKVQGFLGYSDTWEKWTLTCDGGVARTYRGDVLQASSTNEFCDDSLTYIYFYEGSGSFSGNYVYLDALNLTSLVPPLDWTYDYNQLSSEVPDFVSAMREVCFLDQDCRINVKYNSNAIGSDLVFGFSQFDDLYTYQIPSSLPFEHEFEIASTTVTEATTTPYCLKLATMHGDYQRCGMEIVWVDEDEYLIDQFNEDPCLSIATSSGTFSDDFRYGLECSLKRFSYWLFKPSVNSLKRIGSSVEKIKQSFPYTIYNDISYVFQQNNPVIATNTPIVTYGDLINDSGYDNDSYTMLAADTLQDGLGLFWTDKVYLTMVYLTYALGFFYIGYRVYKINKGHDN